MSEQTEAAPMLEASPPARGERATRVGDRLRCPACNARFRAATECSRCGADLLPLMRLAAEAYRLQLACWQALERGDLGRAVALAQAAEDTRASASFHPTALLARLLAQLLAPPRG